MAYERISIGRRAGLILWGAFTLALLYVVFMLSRQLVAMGKSPLNLNPIVETPVATPVATSDSAVGETREVTLFFADPQGELLAPETRSLQLTGSSRENCRRAVEELIHGPQAGQTPIVNDSTKIRGIFMLPGGELVVDFSRDLVADRRTSAGMESLLVYSLANTLTQTALQGNQGETVSRIRILIEGSAPTSSSGNHIDLSAPYGPDPTWVRGSSTGMGGTHG